MKKYTIASLFPALLLTAFSGHAAPSKVTVDGGKINFEGSVVAAPCAVDNTTNGQTVSLGQVPANSLAAKGNTSAAVPFNIKLTGCDLSAVDAAEADSTVSYTSASIIFNGATSGGDNSTLAIQPAAGDLAAHYLGIKLNAFFQVADAQYDVIDFLQAEWAHGFILGRMRN